MKLEIVRKVPMKKLQYTFQLWLICSTDLRINLRINNIIELIKRNLLPSFHHSLSLPHVNSTEELITLCRSIEEVMNCSQMYRPPATNQSKSLEPHLAYHQIREQLLCNTKCHDFRTLTDWC